MNLEKVLPSRFRLSLFFCVLLPLCSCTPLNHSADEVIAISNVTIIDGPGGVRHGMTVLINNEYIGHVAKTAAITFPKNTREIDGSGKFLIPGLWDMHVHLTYEPLLENRMFDLFLGYGITSVRDTGGELEKVIPWRQKSKANPASTPRVFVAGPLLDGPKPVYDGSGDLPKLGIAANTPADVWRIVDELAAANVDFLKAYELLSPEVYLALLQRAEYHDLKVTGHVPLSMDAISVSNAGLNSMEHLRNLPLACASNAQALKTERRILLKESGLSGAQLRSKIHTAQRSTAIENYDAQRCAKVLQVLAKNGTWQIPTMTLNLLAKNRAYTSDRWQQTYDYLPKALAQRWRASISKIDKNPTPAQYVQLANWATMITPELLKAGVPILPGTDTPIFFLTPGFSLHEELAALVSVGMTPMQVITAATQSSAEYFDMGDEVGDIAEGKLADMVLLDANPLEEIRNTSEIRAVVKHGVIFDRTELEGMLRKE